MKKFMDKLRRFMGESTTDATNENGFVNGYLDDEDDVEYYEEEDEE